MGTPIKTCKRCWKVESACFCSEIAPFKVPLDVLILQHPQEAKNPFGTARMVSLSLEGAVHRVGLSWPSLTKAVGHPAQPSEWAVLFASGKEAPGLEVDAAVTVWDRNKRRVPLSEVRGIVLLDGNWKQAKTLWWRNPWLLKLKRLHLCPDKPSRYGQVRKRPRSYYLSTLESVAEVLGASGVPEGSIAALEATQQRLLERAPQI